VTLVAVTKGVSVATIQEALTLGLTDVGENRVQEARAKRQDAGFRMQDAGFRMQDAGFRMQDAGCRMQDRDNPLHPESCILHPVRWHMIGHLQRNKAKDAVEMFDVIHSLDSIALAEELERQAEKQDAGCKIQDSGSGPKPTEVFIQVNVSGEATKFGCPLDEAPTLANVVAQLPHLRLRGLMTIAPFADEPEAARPVFRQLCELRDEVTSSLHLPPSTFCLSMGMSQDFEVAIEEGADYIRVGTAIFGGQGA